MNSLAWLAWVGSALVILVLTRNPVYLLLLVLGIALVGQAVPRRAASPVSAARFALVALPASAFLNALSAHFGAHVLFVLPEWLPLAGGIITLEALAYGALNGLAFVALFAAFGVFNLAVPPALLLRRVPRAFYPLAVVASIALTFVPVLLRQIGQVREAQAIRGANLRGVRAWLPLLMPLFIGSLERAFQLAESLTARGFTGAVSPMTAPARAWLAGALGVLLAGWLLTMLNVLPLLGAGLIGLAGLALLAGLTRANRGTPRTQLAREAWTWRDVASLAASGAALALFVARPAGLGGPSVLYYPYPSISAPVVAGGYVLACLLMLSPLFALTAGAPPRAPAGRAA